MRTNEMTLEHIGQGVRATWTDEEGCHHRISGVLDGIYHEATEVLVRVVGLDDFAEVQTELSISGEDVPAYAEVTLHKAPEPPRVGRPRLYDANMLAKVRWVHEIPELTSRQKADLLGISVTTYYRWLKMDPREAA